MGTQGELNMSGRKKIEEEIEGLKYRLEHGSGDGHTVREKIKEQIIALEKIKGKIYP